MALRNQDDDPLFFLVYPDQNDPTKIGTPLSLLYFLSYFPLST